MCILVPLTGIKLPRHCWYLVPGKVGNTLRRISDQLKCVWLVALSFPLVVGDVQAQRGSSACHPPKSPDWLIRSAIILLATSKRG